MKNFEEFGSREEMSPNYCSYSIGDGENRPWGNWVVLDAGPGYIVKKISVNTGHRLSLQLHRNRAEDWLVAHGTGTAQIGDNILEIVAGSSIHIPIFTPHRLCNNGHETLTLIEIQRGKILEERDIVRLSDDYDRDRR
ncbi:cupin domain-containing protein [Oleomonas cavernae]|uniref:Cupin domain-containing protein n=1 Tax=Oleomonas cavernae TaxID=2320859 RepID=A0A418W958_9PROT|nr:phosphomannose isomerase type II C-terminal cupin domain [Oleomonas cavernae]RJF86464.1 cupin domain-containing protein [Oleomonas cavernae]